MTKPTQPSILSSVDASANLPIRRVGRFYLTEKLGKGASGSVYLGHDPVIDRPVAIKLLATTGNVSGKKQREQQFINEARAAGRLSHPNIVTIYDASSEGGMTYIAMEYLQGKDLRELLASGKHFDVIETVQIVKKIADALAYAHKNGVIHRDIKPGNIFILNDNDPKVVDFGIARAPNRLMDENNPEAHTLFNNNILGTPNYMSPEQAMGMQVNALTDVYSLGAVMYEMLTAQKPFLSTDIDKLLHQIAKKMPRNPSEVNPNISKTLTTIVMTAMQKDPSLRYEDAAAFSSALDKYLERDQKLKRKRKRITPDIKAQTPETRSGSYEDTDSPSWLSWAALVIAVVVVLVSLLR